jgi:hypothetical protein
METKLEIRFAHLPKEGNGGYALMFLIFSFVCWYSTIKLMLSAPLIPWELIDV